MAEKMAAQAMSRFGLSSQTIEKIYSVLTDFPLIEKAVLYGSRAKGNFRNGSDIDLTLIGSQLNHTDLMKIEDRIDDLYLAYSFDISLFHQIENKDLIQHIERVGKEFFKKQNGTLDETMR
jgi:uncharacterized protein